MRGKVYHYRPKNKTEMLGTSFARAKSNLNQNDVAEANEKRVNRLELQRWIFQNQLLQITRCLFKYLNALCIKIVNRYCYRHA